MHNFKKVIASLITVLLLFSILSLMIIEPYFNSEMTYYQDGRLRDSLAGKINLISIGASNNLCAFNSKILDEELNCFSYNLSGTLMTLNARKFLLEKEMERNPVQTVIMDMSYETLTRNENEEHAEGDSVTYARFSTMKERVKFLKKSISFYEWPVVYHRTYFNGIENWLARIKGIKIKGIDYTTKGFLEKKANNIELSKTEAKQNYQIKKLNTEFREENIEKMKDMIKKCHSNNIEVILVVAPSSDSRLWKESDQDVFYSWVTKFSKEQNCTFYDMNLIKNRYQVFNDRESFFDDQHMSLAGAKACTKTFCDIYKKSKVGDVSNMFYANYENMKQDSPYMKYLK